MSSLNAAASSTFIGGARQPPPYTAVRQENNQISNKICTFARDFLIACIITIILIALISIMSSLIIRPRPPRFSVVSAAVAGINATGSEFKAVCNVSVLAENPNGDLVIWYRSLEVLLLYGSDHELSETRLAPMFQRKHNRTVFSAWFVSDDVDVENDVVQGVLSELKRGVVTFRVRILALVRFKRGKWLTRNYIVKADCVGIDIGFLNSTGIGNLIEPNRQCELLPSWSLISYWLRKGEEQCKTSPHRSIYNRFLRHFCMESLDHISRSSGASRKQPRYS